MANMTPDEIKDMVVLGRTVEHQYRLDRYTDKQLAFIQRSINQARNEIVAYIDRKGKDIGAWSEERAKGLLDELNRMTVGVQGELAIKIEDMAVNAGKQSQEAYNRIHSFDGRVKGFNNVALSPTQLRELVANTAVGGAHLWKTLKDGTPGWIPRMFNNELQDKIRREMLTGSLKGEGYGKLVRRIRQGFNNLSTREATTLARSYVQEANVAAMEAVYRANTDIVKAVKWSAVLEPFYPKTGHGTCPRCSALDGTIYRIGESKHLVEDKFKHKSIDEKFGDKKGKKQQQQKKKEEQKTLTAEEQRKLKEEQEEKEAGLVEDDKTQGAEWIPAETIEEATAQFERLGITDHLIEETVNKRLALEALNEAGDEFSSLLQRFPNVKDNQGFNFAIRDKLVLNVRDGRKQTVNGVYSPPLRTVQLATNRSGAPIGAKRVAPTIGEGSWVVSEDFKGTLRHEYGHHVESALLNKEAKKEWTNLYMENSVTGAYASPSTWFQKTVSKYAGTDPREAFAESFAAYTHPLYKQGTLPKVVEEYMERHIGKLPVKKQ